MGENVMLTSTIEIKNTHTHAKTSVCQLGPILMNISPPNDPTDGTLCRKLQARRPSFKFCLNFLEPWFDHLKYRNNCFYFFLLQWVLWRPNMIIYVEIFENNKGWSEVGVTMNTFSILPFIQTVEHTHCLEWYMWNYRWGKTFKWVRECINACWIWIWCYFNIEFNKVFLYLW